MDIVKRISNPSSVKNTCVVFAICSATFFASLFDEKVFIILSFCCYLSVNVHNVFNVRKEIYVKIYI